MFQNGDQNYWNKIGITPPTAWGKENIPWNKGKKGVQKGWHKDVPSSEESKEKNRLAHLGKKASSETRRLMSLKRSGNKNPNWKGGTTPLGILIRQSAPYKNWRIAVFERDNYICQQCGVVGGKLQAHHLMSFALHPELRTDVSNGITLCVSCHKKTDTYLRKQKRAK